MNNCVKDDQYDDSKNERDEIELTNCGRGDKEDNCGDDQHEHYVGDASEMTNCWRGDQVGKCGDDQQEHCVKKSGYDKSEMNNCGRGEQHHNCGDDECEITSSVRGDRGDKCGEHLVEN